MMTSLSVLDVKCTIYLIRIAPLSSCPIWEFLISPVKAHNILLFTKINMFVCVAQASTILDWCPGDRV